MNWHKIVYSNAWLELDAQGQAHYYRGFGCENCGKFFEGADKDALSVSLLVVCDGAAKVGQL